MDGEYVPEPLPRMRCLAVVLLLAMLLGCGARSEVEDVDGEHAADGGSLDAGSASPDIDARVFDTWWFSLASGALRYYVLTLCPDGSARLQTVLSGVGPDVTIDGTAEAGPTATTAILRFDPAEAPMGFAVMHVAYEADGDLLVWREEVDVFPGWASGGGVRDRPGLIGEPASLECR
jgi:hypothetical protein